MFSVFLSFKLLVCVSEKSLVVDNSFPLVGVPFLGVMISCKFYKPMTFGTSADLLCRTREA